jgi:uncharacterized protein YukE
MTDTVNILDMNEEELLERLRGFQSAAAQSWAFEAADTIESLRQQLDQTIEECAKKLNIQGKRLAECQERETMLNATYEFESLSKQLAECQAKVQKYRGDIASYIAMEQGEDAAANYIANQPSDSTALDTMLAAAELKGRREALLEAAESVSTLNACNAVGEYYRKEKELE